MSNKILEHQKANRTEILNELWKYQLRSGFISDKEVEDLASKMGMSKVVLEGVISFYHFFHRKPTGEYVVYLNNSIASETKGFKRVKEAFEKETGARFGMENINGDFALFTTACIGLSDQEPAALINFYPFTNLNSLKVRQIIAQIKKGIPVSEICDEIPDNIRHTPSIEKTVFFRDYKPGSTLRNLAKLSPEEVINEIKKSNLRGMGGAFFPVGIKWASCRQETEKTKYIVCNADEGEPGTYKDRVLMNHLPGLLLEGMITAGYAVGAREGIIYLRAEYMWLRDSLQQTINQFWRDNLLGQNIAGIDGFHFDIRIQLGAGAYVCGEETALLNSLEGKRGEPRTKMYFPTQRGFLNKPTVVNNVETLCAAARIIELGADHYLQTGTQESSGTKLISVSGDCHRPGIYEIEWGVTIREILELCAADDPYYIQVSGPSGECISLEEQDRCLAMDDLKCGGSFMIFNSNRDVLGILDNFAAFFRQESCGICTPCRAGNFIVKRQLEKIRKGLAYREDLDQLVQWSELMSTASRCGLGKSATNALHNAMAKFPKSFTTYMGEEGDGQHKAFDEKMAVLDYEKFKI